MILFALQKKLVVLNYSGIKNIGYTTTKTIDYAIGDINMKTA